MDLKEIGISTRDWVDSTLDMNYWRALVNAPLDFFCVSKDSLILSDNLKSVHIHVSYPFYLS